MKKKLIWIGLFVFSYSSAFAQVRGSDANWGTLVPEDYDVNANIVYKKCGGLDQKLDVISARDKSKPRRTISTSIVADG